MKKRAFKTSLLFLGIILIGVFVRLFVTESELFVSSDPSVQTASSSEGCVVNKLC